MGDRSLVQDTWMTTQGAAFPSRVPLDGAHRRHPVALFPILLVFALVAAGATCGAAASPQECKAQVTACTPACADRSDGRQRATCRRRCHAATAKACRLVRRFLDKAYFRFHPAEGTRAGQHRFDHRLEDVSRASNAAEATTLRRYLSRFGALRATHLSPPSAIDRELAISRIKGALLELETIRTWQKDADRYSTLVSTSIFLLMNPQRSTPEARLRAVVARERRIPKLFDAARANLDDPPRVFTEIAQDNIESIERFFVSDVPAAFAEVRNEKLKREFEETNAAVIEAVRAYRAFLGDLLPRSNGDFRLGPERYAQKLLYDEMVDTPIDRLLAMGWEDLRRNQSRFKETAAVIDPNRTAEEILSDLGRQHPDRDQLLQTFRDRLDSLRAFVVGHDIVTLPSMEPPRVEETPPFARALTFASLEGPGPFERSAQSAFFYVPLPAPTSTPQQMDEYLAAFNRGTIVSTAVHEVYPGHYVQLLWQDSVASKLTSVEGFYTLTNAEGWAHYCEQMMLGEGYGDGDPWLRLGQLQDALLRDARYLVSIQIHTAGMTLEDAEAFFEREGYQTRENARIEARRGTSDPLYLSYTLGKLELLELREDYRARRGPAFTLRDFHDRVLALGGPPLALVRKVLLGDESPPP